MADQPADQPLDARWVSTFMVPTPSPGFRVGYVTTITQPSPHDFYGKDS
jgi:hypothetical protein